MTNTGLPQPRRLIKDFEREARTDGLPAEDLAARKRLLVGELNGFIAQKKAAAGVLEARRELVADGRANKAGAEIMPSGALQPAYQAQTGCCAPQGAMRAQNGLWRS